MTPLVATHPDVLSQTGEMPYFAVYAPDYTDEGAIERRFKVREAHLANAAKEPRMSSYVPFPREH